MEMDLEVREPIDFSSGDHQHLVRKAADSNIHTKAGQPYATSPSEAPKTHGNPRPKTREQMDIYVVQISDETTPDDSNNLANPFSDSWIRRAFIIKVFLILSAQLVVTGAIVSVFLFWKGLKAWVLVNAWFTYAILPAFFVVLIVLACCGKLRRQVPANYILLGLFTVLQGLLLGAVSVFYNAEEVLWATAATALVTLSLTLFALQTKVCITETDFCHKGVCRCVPLPLLTHSYPSSLLLTAVLWAPPWPPHLLASDFPSNHVQKSKNKNKTEKKKNPPPNPGEINFNHIFYLTKYMQGSNISVVNITKILNYLTSFFELKFKSSVYFLLTAHFTSDQPHFKCSLATSIECTAVDKHFLNSHQNRLEGL
ncbi:uncharacterized protein AAEQ78_017697 isoform 1-T2 [Lycaon pictus]